MALALKSRSLKAKQPRTDLIASLVAAVSSAEEAVVPAVVHIADAEGCIEGLVAADLEKGDTLGVAVGTVLAEVAQVPVGSFGAPDYAAAVAKEVAANTCFLACSHAHVVAKLAIQD